jgi:hypothetical protein
LEITATVLKINTVQPLFEGKIKMDSWILLGITRARFGRFFNVYKECFLQISIFPSPGNHDYNDFIGLNQQHRLLDVTHYKIFIMPQNGEGGG